MDLPQPITREELYLAYYVGLRGFALPPEPATRIELYLAKLCGKQSVQLPSRPVTNAEIYLAKLCGEDVQLPAEPILRVDFYLAKLCGEDVQLPPEPYTKTEAYLAFAATTEVSEVVISGEMSTIEDTLEGIGFSEVQLLGDSFQQTYTGKNLVKVTATSQTIGAITFTVNNDGTVVVNGTNGNSVVALNLIGDDPIVLPAGQYENSGCPYGGNDSTYRLDINNGSNNNQICYGTPKSFTTTSELTITNYRIRIAPNAVIDNLVFKPMIRSTSAGDSTFEPYTGSTPSQITPAPNPDYPQDINVVTGEQTVKVTGKNLFDKNNPNSRTGNVEANGTLNLTGNNRTFFLKCEPNTTYTIQKRNDGDVNRFIVAWSELTPENGIPVYGRIQDYDANSITITTGATAKYLLVTYYRNAETVLTEQQVIDSIQVELGSTATDYQPYQSQSYPLFLGSLELCKIGDYQDYIWTDGEKWYKHAEIGKAVFTGSVDESWSIENSGTPNFYYRLNNGAPGTWATQDNWTTTLSNYGTPNTVYNSNRLNGIGILSAASSAVVRIRYGEEMALADWKAKLAATPMVLYYPLATPTDEEITNATLISQLNALANAYGYAGETNFFITAEDPNLPTGLKLKVRRAV